MELNNPATFALYLHYNDKHLEDEEKVKVNNIIEKLRRERSAINRKNIEYMERDKVAKLIEETE
jgi:glycerol dehydrogenase-like iron-containing ADH family enzyme